MGPITTTILIGAASVGVGILIARYLDRSEGYIPKNLGLVPNDFREHSYVKWTMYTISDMDDDGSVVWEHCGFQCPNVLSQGWCDHILNKYPEYGEV